MDKILCAIVANYKEIERFDLAHLAKCKIDSSLKSRRSREDSNSRIGFIHAQRIVFCSFLYESILPTEKFRIPKWTLVRKFQTIIGAHFTLALSNHTYT